jgi:hypothetical protein
MIVVVWWALLLVVGRACCEGITLRTAPYIVFGLLVFSVLLFIWLVSMFDREGPTRDWVAAGARLVLMILITLAATATMNFLAFRYFGVEERISYALATVGAMAITFVLWRRRFLQLLPAKCPECKALALIPTIKNRFPRIVIDTHKWCASCGQHVHYKSCPTLIAGNDGQFGIIP